MLDITSQIFNRSQQCRLVLVRFLDKFKIGFQVFFGLWPVLSVRLAFGVEQQPADGVAHQQQIERDAILLIDQFLSASLCLGHCDLDVEGQSATDHQEQDQQKQRRI